MTKFSQPVWGGEEREKEREREKGRDSRERSSTFSLDFSVIGPANSGGARSKVGLRYKGYAWVPVLWSFDKLWKVGVFSYSVYFWFESLVNGLGVVRLEMAMDFSSTKWNRCLVSGLPTDSPLLGLGLLKTVPICVLDRKCPCVIFKILLKINGLQCVWKRCVNAC